MCSVRRAWEEMDSAFPHSEARGGGGRNLVAPAESSEILLRLFLCVRYVFQWHTNADRPRVCGS